MGRRGLALWALWMGCTPAPVEPTDDTDVVEDTEDTEDTEIVLETATATADTAVPEETAVPPASFCAAWDDCSNDRVCDVATGRCRVRTVWTESQPQLFTVQPEAVAPGDLLVIDGQRFWSNLFLQGLVRVRIDGQRVDRLGTFLPDHTRLLIPITEETSGSVEVITDDQSTLVWNRDLQVAPSGTLACDDATPEATGLDGLTVDDVGPHAAGYLDISSPPMRIYYPADCGGLRRPGAMGFYPLVLLLHGDDMAPVNYGYLGQRLATWGFVSINPFIDNLGDTGVAAAEIDQVRAALDATRDTDLGTVSPVLAGVETSLQFAAIGHSMGAARIQRMAQADDVRGSLFATVFLGPMDEGVDVPGRLMMFQGTQDRQSFPFTADPIYARHAGIKYKVTLEGGNHSLFTDHKVWAGLLDGRPSLSRKEQLRAVTSYVLPHLQRAFGLPEPFGDRLDTPPVEPNITVEQAAP